ncbi:MAG: amidohydrolase family protein, partial [Leptolinea sp.]
MGKLLLEHIDSLATFDEHRQRINNAWVLINGNIIEAIGSTGSEPLEVDRRIDLSGYVVLPGMVNTHHHLFQSLLRNIPVLQDVSLFSWLHYMYLLMSEVRDEDQYYATQVNHAELLLSGCTTSVDHSYLHVNDMKFDTQIRAARELGIRFHLARGSFSIGKSKGGLPPDHIIEDEDDILADTERLIKAYHDPKPGAMVRIDNAPCSPFSVTPRLMKESIALARRFGVGSHTHLAENIEDHKFVTSTYGKSSVRLAEDWGWVGPDVWFAHSVFLDDAEIQIMASTGTAVAHCPNSNMYTAAGCCRVRDLLRAGVT